MCLARSLKVVNEVLTELDLGFNEIRVRNCYFIEFVHRLKTSCTILHWFCVQDDGAFAIAQALKANEDVKITSLNLANNFLTKFGQVILLPLILIHGFIFFSILSTSCAYAWLYSFYRVLSLMQEIMYTRWMRWKWTLFSRKIEFTLQGGSFCHMQEHDELFFFSYSSCGYRWELKH